ncbi:hypothetical protein RJ640_001257 [Escallonia rubra]|uniref:Reverse transcriptase Ty1/copia-type domain-containing protein n=1 Tax=Escallonia rubra TaxID=112253 RepID=A0AA88UTV8_9ASTE|nr:hypothetical protein RJ640_001257 [Escallonia rubra]
MNGKGDILIVCLYVDDLIFAGNNVKMFDDFKKEMAKEFEMTNIGLMSYYLGIEVKQRDDGIFILQEAYAKEVLKRFNMENCNPITFTWTSKKQSIVTLSTCEAEYVAATLTVCHAIWLRSLLKELSFIQDESTQIYVDIKSAIALAKNPVFHDRRKHIDTRYHFIRESIAKKQVQVKFVKSEDQNADIFTKPLNRESLRILYYPFYGSGALGGFAAAYPFLEELRLKRMTVSDESLEFIATSFPCLKSLSLLSCDGFSTVGLKSIASHCTRGWWFQVLIGPGE